MVSQRAGFPYWEVAFGETGRVKAAGGSAGLLSELPAQQLTDLFVFAHGWQNEPPAARRLYERLLQQMAGVLADQQIPRLRASTIGAVGVLWPATAWAEAEDGGAVALGDGAAALAPLRMMTGTRNGRGQAYQEMARLLDEQELSEQALARFQSLLARVTTAAATGIAAEDGGERAILQDRPMEVFEQLHLLTAGAIPPPVDDEGGGAADLGGGLVDDGEGGAVGLLDPFRRAWAGAKVAARQLTYWQMKARAGVVGRDGLGPLIGRLHQQQPDLRVHLVGHSFGARLVSYALAGLPAGVAPTPVKSVLLLQGAFSHYAFAPRLPHDPGRAGALAGMLARIDGPLVVTHTQADTAVGTLYPMGSMLTGQDAAGLDDLVEKQLQRWGAIGHDGAQGVNAVAAPLGPVRHDYRFQAGTAVNLDGNHLMTSGDPPSGAHGDLFHDEIAWAGLAAAGILSP